MGVESMRYRLFINVTYYALCEYLWVWKYVL